MALNNDQINAIVLTLFQNDYIDGIPQTTKELVDTAEYWIIEAEKAWHQNRSVAKNDEAIRTILNIVGVPEDETYHEPSPSDKLPIPKEPDFSYEQLPSDFTEMTETELRKYSSHHLHFFNRARYLLGQVKNHLADANHLRDDAYRRAYVRYNDELEAAGERTTKDLIDSYVRTKDDEFRKYDKDAREANKNINELAALVEIYSGNVERLSREATLRHNEWERSR